MNTTTIGNQAESIVKTWLEHKGYTIVDRNWKTRWCEIDIVATKKKIVYFVEVRHRRSSLWGDGIDSVTSKKHKQIEFAANFWIHQKNWQDDARILIVATGGNPPQVTSAIEL